MGPPGLSCPIAQFEYGQCGSVRVVRALHKNVVIEPTGAHLLCCQPKETRRQGTQKGLVVERLQIFADCLIELWQRQKTVISQSSQEDGGDDNDGAFLCDFVLGRTDFRR